MKITNSLSGKILRAGVVFAALTTASEISATGVMVGGHRQPSTCDNVCSQLVSMEETLAGLQDVPSWLRNRQRQPNLPRQRNPPRQHSQSPPAVDPNEQRILDALCTDLEPEPNGGYSATAFGTALRNLGLKKATKRRRFIAKTTAIEVRGTGPDKRYFIHPSG